MLSPRKAYIYRMRRPPLAASIFLTVLMLVFASISLASSAAAQQRDPFDPVIDLNPGTGIPDGSPEEAPVVLPVPDPDEPLPATGDSTSSDHLGVAYLLIACGAMLVVLAKINSTSSQR